MGKFLLSAFADEASGQLEGQIAALKRNGFKFIEIRNVDGSCIINHSDISLKEIKSRLDSEGIRASAIGSPIGKIAVDDDFEPHIEAFKRTINAAHMLDTKRVRMFSFYVPSQDTADSYKNAVLERLHTLIELAKKDNILCCIENEVELYGDVKSRALVIANEFGGDAPAIFDPANYIHSGEKPSEIFDDLYPFVDYIHIKDARYSDGAVVPSGFGDSDIAGMLRKFTVKEGDRFLSVEPHLAVFEGLDKLSKNEIKHSFAYPSFDDAFDAACSALKEILNKGKFSYE